MFDSFRSSINFQFISMTKETKNNLISRPPVVVVLGHIDHGKSSLLEAIRDFKITEKESGGITQHIGAYQVEVDKSPSSAELSHSESEGRKERKALFDSSASTREVEEQGKKITFLDTPGHEAFSQMRSRGAKVADIAILVIDATEGVKVQTKEAIEHVKKAGLPLIVALNKMDRPEANPEKVKGELKKEEILVESIGGRVPSVEVSARTKKGVAELLDLILLVAEMEDLKADPEKPGEGVVIESYLDNLRGPTATLLLTQGQLKKGDIIGTPSTFTKIKSLEDFQKKPITQAFPSQPIIIFGFEKVPKLGEKFRVFADIESAQNHLKAPEKETARVFKASEGQKVLSLILKVDVLGSVEAIESILQGLPQEKVVLEIIKSEVGNINESDIQLAKGSKAVIFAFRVKTDKVAQKLAERDKVRIFTFEVIYDLVEATHKLMEKLVEPEVVRMELGKTRVLAKFISEKNRQIVGGRVTEGEVKKGASIEVWREDEKIGQGRMVNLQRNKKDIDSVAKGDECGILFEGEVKIEEGDTLIFYQEERHKGEI